MILHIKREKAITADIIQKEESQNGKQRLLQEVRNMRKKLIASLMICILLLIAICEGLSAVAPSSGAPLDFQSGGKLISNLQTGHLIKKRCKILFRLGSEDIS